MTYPDNLYKYYHSNTNETPNTNPQFNMALDYSDITEALYRRPGLYPARCIILKGGFYK